MGKTLWIDKKTGGKMTIKTIFFDLGGVLINFSLHKMCQNIADFCGLDLDVVKTHLFEKNLGEKYEKGIIDSQVLHEHFSQLSGRPLNFAGLMEAAAKIFSPKREMLAILKKLKKNHIRLYLLSNTCEAHFSYIKKEYQFLNFFDGHVLSYQVGARKPEKKIYNAAFELAKTPIENCFYVDDIAEYVETALKFGLDSHLFLGANHLLQALEKKGCIPK